MFLDSCIIIAIDDGRVAFAKVGGTVCLVADAVGRDILIFFFVCDIVIIANCGTNRSAGAFSINVCVDNGIAGAAVDVDVTSSTTVSSYNSANCRAGVTGSIIWAVIRTNGIDRIYGAAGNVDGCCGSIDGSRSSDCGTIIGTDGGNVGILFNIDREIRSIAIPAVTNGTTLVAFCRYGSISGDRNSIRAVVTACVIATSNCSVKIRTSIDNGIVRNGDAVSTAGTTADPGTRFSKGSNMSIAFNADVLAGTVAAAANGSSAIISGNGSDITISGGKVIANGGLCGAGIGGGYKGSGSDVTISKDSRVEATGGDPCLLGGYGAAIGGGGYNTDTGNQVDGSEIEPDTSGLYTTGKVERKSGDGTVLDTIVGTVSASSEEPDKREPLYRVLNLDGSTLKHQEETADRRSDPDSQGRRRHSHRYAPGAGLSAEPGH